MGSDVVISSARYYVAVDFVTHGSGFAYMAKSDTNSNPRAYDNWSGWCGTPTAKTRTALLHRKADLSKPQAWGWEAVVQYADLPADERDGFLLFESFKKYLMPNDFPDLPALPCCITPFKLVSDFLGCLYKEVILPTLKDDYGSRFQVSAVRWCLTVPAGLSQSSIALMRRAAMAAGLVPSTDSPALLITSEPEAAALTAQQKKDLPGQKLVAGGRLMLIDMGGGTVDMTVYEVDSLAAADAMRMSELTHRECLAEGATRVDERFRSHLEAILGPEAVTEWASDPTNAAELQDLLYDEWETCKCAFEGGPCATATPVNLPYSLVYGASDEGQARLEAAGHTDRLVLTPSTMAGFFLPSLQTIIKTAQAMLARAHGADVIVLVGGFSASKFVRRELAAALQAGGGPPVVTPDYGATAVLEGGAWFSHYPSAIAARRSCMSYGIRSAVPWTEGAPDRTWLPHMQAYRCLHGFVRYVKRDELVRAGSVISKTFTPLFPNQSGVSFDIYGCLDRNARFITSPTMTRIASVQVDFPPVSDPDLYTLTAEFSFGETQISVRCVDENTGKEVRTELLFDSSEMLDAMVAATALLHC